MTARLATALSAALVTLGCATVQPLDHSCAGVYQPLEVASDVSPSRLLAAASRALRDDGYLDVRLASDGQRVIGASPEHDGMRDRAKIEIVEGRFRVDLRTELYAGVANWIRSDEVCATYTYAREHALAEAIVHDATPGALTAQR